MSTGVTIYLYKNKNIIAIKYYKWSVFSKVIRIKKKTLNIYVTCSDVARILTSAYSI